MLWLLSGIVLLIGPVIQAAQAIDGYRRTSSADLQTAADRQREQTERANALVEDEVREGEALRDYLSLENPHQVLKELVEELGPMPAGIPSLEDFMVEHRDEIQMTAARAGP